MLCIMHEAVPYGSLRVNGKGVNDRQLAVLAGGDVADLLTELEDAGVFSRDDEGVIISRRMQRDKAKADTDKANGKRGGNPGLKTGVNPPVKGEDKAQKPEARDQSSDASHPQRVHANPEFEEWYRHYPHKVGRGQAERAFATARKIASLQDLIDGLQRYVATKPAAYAWRNPATWLNGKGWLDVPAPEPISPRQSSPPPRERTVSDALAEMAAGTWKGPPGLRTIDEPDFPTIETSFSRRD